MHELLWKVRPDVVVECGVAHGGALVLYASGARVARERAGRRGGRRDSQVQPPRDREPCPQPQDLADRRGLGLPRDDRGGADPHPSERQGSRGAGFAAHPRPRRGRARVLRTSRHAVELPRRLRRGHVSGRRRSERRASTGRPTTHSQPWTSSWPGTRVSARRGVRPSRRHVLPCWLSSSAGRLAGDRRRSRRRRRANAKPSGSRDSGGSLGGRPGERPPSR